MIKKNFFQLSNSLNALTTHKDTNRDRKLRALELGINADNLAIPYQVHSSVVLFIDKVGSYKNCDGLITDNQNIVLSLETADCVPVFFYDPVKRIKGLIHAGWRGIVKGIIKNTIEIFLDYKCDLKNIIVILGPSICIKCYEVHIDVAQNFQNSAKLFKSNGKWKVSLQKQITYQLNKYGISRNKVKISEICTFENIDCSSFRRGGKTSGCMFSFLNEI